MTTQVSRLTQMLSRFADEFIHLSDTEKWVILTEALNWSQHTALQNALECVGADLGRDPETPQTQVDKANPGDIDA